jgi:hypothetical protein
MCWQKSVAICSLTHGMLIRCTNTTPDVFILLIKIQCFSSYKFLYVTLSSGPSIEGAHQPHSKNDKSRKKDDVFLISLDAFPQPSIRQFRIGA